jgi:hypothetical protein
LSGEDHLEGDDAIETDLPRVVNNAHAAAGDLFKEFVIPEVADFGSEWRAEYLDQISGQGPE